MYGEPIKPNRALFYISEEEGTIEMFVVDMDDPSNDGIRDIVHPEFDNHWGNSMENTFVAWTKEENAEQQQ